MQQTTLVKIPGYTGYYAGSDGHIYSEKYRKRRRLTEHISCGYLRVCLSENNIRISKTVHGLISLAFRGKTPEGLNICHGPKGRLDNSLENLYWATPSQNNKEDKMRDGKLLYGQNNPAAKLANTQVIEIRRLLNIKTLQTIADIYGVSKQTIWRIKQGKKWERVT